jgi:hypothetical protein
VIWFGGEFTFQDSAGVVHPLNAEAPWDTMTMLFDLRHDSIQSARADSSSRLEVLFGSGAILRAGPDPNYENWELVGPDDLYLVGVPGGGDPRISGGLE